MKRIAFPLLAIAILIPCIALASYALSDMSIDELVTLRSEINAELMERGYEKEVTIPAGTYIIGEDIPAGAYTIRHVSRSAMVTVYDENGRISEYHSVREGEIIGKMTMLNKQTVEISSGSVIFAPYVGLGF